MRCSSAASISWKKDIDLYSNYHAAGENYNNHSESDTTSTYDFTGMTDKGIEIDISGIFSNIQAGDLCGIQVDHKSIGGAIDYLDVYGEYK